MTVLGKSPKRLGVVVAVAWLAGCSDGSGPVCCDPLLQGVIVSNPVASAALTAETGGALALAPDAADDLAYVSLPPGTVPTGSWASVRRVGDAASITTAVADGGFDPVPVIAQAGDSIEVVVRDNDGSVALQQTLLVAASRRPIIVRTDPPPRKRDVPLNASVVIVFSEPMNASTLNASSVQLFRGTTSVAGTVSLLAGTATSAVFAPGAPLDASTDYQLVVTPAVRDLGGDALEAGETVEFTTGTTLLGPVASVSVEPQPDTITAAVFWRGTQYQFTATARDAQGVVVTGHPVTWISDNSAVATVSVTGLVTALATGEATIRAEVDGQTGQVTVRVLAGPIRVSVSPAGGSVVVNGTRLFTATVDNDPSNSGVTWSLTGCAGGAAVCGSLASITNTTATYTAPATVPSGSLGVTATSVTDPTKSFTATMSVTATAASGQIAFNANGEIYVMNADGSGVRNLTNNPASDGGLACSPDGTRIAFVSGRDGNAEIYVMNADGSGLRNLTNNPASDGGPAWSPDGTRIAFSSDRDGDYGIYEMNADGSGLRYLTNYPASDEAITWSPDRTRIAFVSGRDGDYEIYVMNADGSGLRNITNNPASDGGLAWSPDGTRIDFISDRDGDPQVYVMNADGSGVTRLTNNLGLHAGVADAPTWSPDGTGIAFVGVPSGRRPDIYVMNADGSDLRDLTYNGASHADHAWSPDDTRIAFRQGGCGFRGLNCVSDIYVMNADGSGVVRLTNDHVAGRPAWLR